MLVLGRETGQAMHITIPADNNPGGDIEFEIVLVEIRDHKRARIGIDAPQFVRVVREELLASEDAKEAPCPTP